MSGQSTDGTERFEYLVIADCGHCGQELKYVEEFDEPAPLDYGVEIKWGRCPYCQGPMAPAWWDVKSEYEIERVKPTQERSLQPGTDRSGGADDAA